MVNRKIERTEVLEPCIKLCKRLKGMGYILKWRRLDALDYYHEPGDPDIEIWFSRENTLWILMCECKSPEGKLRLSQIEYRDKYRMFKNVTYQEIKDVKILERLILEHADNINLKPEQLKEMKNTEL